MTMITECQLCGAKVKINANKAKDKHKDTFGYYPDEPVIVCKNCYENVLNAVMNSADESKEN